MNFDPHGIVLRHYDELAEAMLEVAAKLAAAEAEVQRLRNELTDTVARTGIANARRI